MHGSLEKASRLEGTGSKQVHLRKPGFLYCSTLRVTFRNHTQYFVITYKGKGSEKMYIYITESLYCTPQTNKYNIENQLYLKKRKKERKKKPVTSVPLPRGDLWDKSPFQYFI